MKKTHQMRSSVIAAYCVLGLTMNATAAINLAVNGDFETGTTAGWTDFPTSTPFAVTGDAQTGSFAGQISNTLAPSGSVVKQENLGIGVLTPGETITISFWAKGDAAAGGVHFAEFFGAAPGESQFLGGGPLFPGPDYAFYEYTRTAGPDAATNGVTLQFGAITGADSGSVSNLTIDNVNVSIVPEPSALILGASGLGFLAFRRRRA